MEQRDAASPPRTSSSHPLQIAFVQARGNGGRIGITFCPGKKQHDALTGAWDRDLCVDLDAIHASGAAAVVTLIEPSEFLSLGVDRLGEEVRARHMDWFHLPIADVSIPGRCSNRNGPSPAKICAHGFARASTSWYIVRAAWDALE